MTEFADFKPIVDNSQNEAVSYYKENNIPFPDNDYFKDYFDINNEFKKKLEKKMEPYKLEKVVIPKKDTEVKTTVEEPIEFPPLKPLDTSGTKAGLMKNEMSYLQISDADQAFLLKLAKKESNFDPNVVNQFGYKGYYQFGKDALQDVGFTVEDFKDPMKQHKAALKLRDMYLIPLKKYIGRNFRGVTLTADNLVGMAWNAGPQGVKDLLDGTKKSDYAKRGFKDGNGTSILSYLREFS